MEKRKIVVIDGHDGSGKTTIAKKVAEKYSMKYVKPFSNDLGDFLAWAIKNNEYDFVNKIALEAVKKQMSENKGIDLVFDRHWLSMFTVLPDEFHREWDIPFTICCWADVDTTLLRLKNRNNNEEDEWDHKYYCDIYKKYAEQYGVPILNTSENTDVDYNMMLIDEYIKHYFELQ